MLQSELHIPPGINYECTSCGPRAAAGGAVPMTQDDYERISATNWARLAQKAYAGRDLFRQLKKARKLRHTLHAQDRVGNWCMPVSGEQSLLHAQSAWC